MGTWIGVKFLKKIPKDMSRKQVLVLIVILGIFMIFKGVLGLNLN